MQSGPLATRTENQKQITKSAAHFQKKCAPVCRIHVSFAYNQQLANCQLIRYSKIRGSEIQSGGALAAPGAEYQKQISKNTIL